MALDFELKLILPQDNMAIFSRGALEMTIKLIRNRAPNLASDVDSILQQEPLPTGSEQSNNPQQHMFFVELPGDKVNLIVELILNIVDGDHSQLSAGMVVIAKALFKDWLELSQSKMHR